MPKKRAKSRAKILRERAAQKASALARAPRAVPGYLQAYSGRQPGRTSKYDPRFIPVAEKMCQMGATHMDLAQAFQVHHVTVSLWMTQYPDFGRACKVGKEFCDDMVEASLYQRARGFTIQKIKYFAHEGVVTDEVEIDEYYPPDVGAGSMWLKNRQPEKWRDRSDSNVNLSFSGTVKHTLDPAELDAAPLDEVQRLFAEEIALSPGVQLLPPPPAARDAAVQEGRGEVDGSLDVDPRPEDRG